MFATETAIIEMAIKSEIIVRMMMDGGGADISIRLEESDLGSEVEMNDILKLERKTRDEE
jgi:hypothetical protein